MDNPFENSELTSILVVSDTVKSKKFYVEKLGASLIREYDGSIVLKFLGHWVLLVAAGAPTEDKPNTRFIPPQNPDDVAHSFTIRVENCQLSYEALVKRGVEFLTPPYDWGAEIRCFFKDPSGHLYEISEYKGE